MNLHLISFGAPEQKYAYTRNRFYNEALNLGVFKSIKVLSDIESFDYTKELLDHKDFLYSTRGFGYWIWKYFLISEMMKEIESDDILMYCDSGCTLNPNGLNRLQYYVNLAYEKGSLVFDVGHPEFKYTKMDTYKRVFGNDFENLETNQICATAFFLKNNDTNKKIIEEIKKISTENKYHYVSDAISNLENDSRFLEHRHDQSIFSLISKKNNFFVMNDETYWNPDWNVSGKNYPIWATRFRP
jgi:hypothetical protein